MLKRLFTAVLLLGVGAGIAILYASPWEDNQEERGAVDRVIAEKVSVSVKVWMVSELNKCF